MGNKTSVRKYEMNKETERMPTKKYGDSEMDTEENIVKNILDEDDLDYDKVKDLEMGALKSEIRDTYRRIYNVVNINSKENKEIINMVYDKVIDKLYWIDERKKLELYEYKKRELKENKRRREIEDRAPPEVNEQLRYVDSLSSSIKNSFRWYIREGIKLNKAVRDGTCFIHLFINIYILINNHFYLCSFPTQSEQGLEYP